MKMPGTGTCLLLAAFCAVLAAGAQPVEQEAAQESDRARLEALTKQPIFDFDEILVNRNPPTMYSHNGDQNLGRHSRVGKGLTIVSGWQRGAPQARTILEGKMPPGAYRNPDLSYDGKRVVFAFCDHTEPNRNLRRFLLYEAAIDGSWVRQLTGTKRDTFATWNDRATVLIEDNDPCYLPSGEIVFISTRCQTFGRCHGGRYNPGWTLHKCDKDGNNITQLSFGNENEAEPSVLNDGRIIFMRWEYTNRHEMFFHKLWWCRPDGTGITHFFGNDMIKPHQFVEATAIPGSHKVVATAQGHHSYNTGTIVVLDTNIDENGEHAITHVTPETPYSESQGWPNPHYSHAHPLSEEIFLVSRANHRVHRQKQVPPPADRAIYIINTAGLREKIYEDPEVASFSPIPIRPRKEPPVLPAMTVADAEPYGTLFLQNAYLTRNDPKGIIKPGMIKALRVNALGVQPRARRRSCTMTVRNDLPKKALGTVPVDEDGSAFFKVPANTALQVQTLDENGMALLTEKSFFYLQPGENRSCIGCHEEVGSTPSPVAMSKMTSMKPMELKPAAGPQYRGGMSFARTVQPVLDRHCIGCHGLGGTTNSVNLVYDTPTYPRSLKAIVGKGQHSIGDKRFSGRSYAEYPGVSVNISRPRKFFAYENKVAHMLLKGEKGHPKLAETDRESYMRVIEWLDLNGQCFGDLFPNRIEDRGIDAEGLAALRTFAEDVYDERIARQPARALINVAQPDESRILMMGLPFKAGGWGQVKAFRDKDDAKYKRMAELVDGAIVRKKNENTNGWEPTRKQGAAEKWVLEARSNYLHRADTARKPDNASTVTPATLSQAIQAMIAEFGDRYPRGNDFLAQLAGIEKSEPCDRKALEELARDAYAGNPLLNTCPILFVTRHQYRKDHHNTATLFQTGEINHRSYVPGGPMKSIDFKQGGKVTEILDPGPTGLLRDPEVSFDGKRIVFSMRKSRDDDYHIYTVNADGSKLEQLTGAAGVADIDPLFLPDGGIIFSSTREPKYCMCNRHIMCNLFRMEADGANIRQIGKSTLFEGHSALLPDGRILYDRWEYVDRNFGDAQGLWTVNPDGAGHAIYYGNNTASPGGVIDARSIPGTREIVAVLAGCHDRPWGALAVIDRRKGVDGAGPVQRTWPASFRKQVSTQGSGKWDSSMRLPIKYEDPYPLSDKVFLVSRSVGKGEKTGLFLVDIFGNEVLLHEEPRLGCYDPMPLGPRTMPATLARTVDYTKDTGVFYLQNVYEGTHMQGVQSGEIKSLRIVESPEKRNWTPNAWGGQGAQAPGMNWSNFENKRILGTVPVEDDGSACFEVPADRFVFFQVLDADGCMVQTMRSGTIVRPGEIRSCVGCHEDRLMGPDAYTALSKASRRAPSRPGGVDGEPQLFSYRKMVQPIFDRHCVRCHDFGKEAGKKLNLAGDQNNAFNTSYVDLWSKGYIRCIGAGPAALQPAKSWGARHSKLIHTLRKGHSDVKLDPRELQQLVTWIDINGPYYPTYDSAYPNSRFGRSPLTNAEYNRLEQLTGAEWAENCRFRGTDPVSFTRPELSPCLSGLAKDSSAYREALAILKAGQQRLQQAPRADTDGFKPAAGDQRRNAKWTARAGIEKENRAAIVAGGRVYDSEVGREGGTQPQAPNSRTASAMAVMFSTGVSSRTQSWLAPATKPPPGIMISSTSRVLSRTESGVPSMSTWCESMPPLNTIFEP